MSTHYLEANRATGNFAGRNAVYAGSDSGDSDEGHNDRPYHDDEKNIRKLQVSDTSASLDSLKSISHKDHSHHKFYKPLSNRTPVLSIFLLVIGTCILLMELAISTHPNADSVKSILRRAEPDVGEPPFHLGQRNVNEAGHVKRDSETTTPTLTAVTESSITSKSIVTSEATISSISPSTATSPNNVVTSPDPAPTTHVTPGQPNPNNQLITNQPDTTSQRLTGAPAPSSFLITASAPTSSQKPLSDNARASSFSTYFSPASNSQLVTSYPDGPTLFQPAPSSLLITNSQSNANPNSNNGPSTSRPVVAPSPAPDSQLVTINPNSNTNSAAVSVTNKVTATVTGTNGAVSIITSAVISVISTPAQQASIVSGSVIKSGSVVIGTLSGSGAASDTGAGVFALTNSQGQTTATVSFTGAAVLTNSNGQVTATISYTAAQSATPTSATDSSSLTAQNAVAWTKFSYFCAKYLPIVLAVVLQATWLIIFSTFKMMEPFYQLASPQGAATESSLTADYLSAGLSLSFIKAAIDGHWVMLLAGLIQLCLAIIVSLSSDTFNIVPTAFCQTAAGTNPCAPKWVVNMWAARTVEVLLVGCFSMVLMAIVLNINRVSGVYTDPSKIATMADVLVHKPFIQELRDISPSATKTEVDLDLKDNRYMLGTLLINGREQYGIIKLDVLPQSSNKESAITRLGRRFDFWWERKVDDFNKKLPYASDFLCMILALVLWIIVLAYYVTPGTDVTNPFNIFMAKHQVRFGASFVLSIIAVSMGFLLKHKERDYRLSHPYVVMSKGPQPADQCITTGLRSTQYTALPKSIWSNDITLALLSLAAILSDLNLILVPGIPWTPAQTTEVYKASTFGCLTIVLIVIIVHIRVTFKQWRRGHNAENPGTLATVFMRLCGSRFVEEKNNQAIYGPVSQSEFWQGDDARQSLKYGGPDNDRMYRFGCMEGVDGTQRYMIEEDFWAQKQPSSSHMSGKYT